MSRQFVDKYWVLDLDRCLGAETLYTDAYEAAGHVDSWLEQELRHVQARVQAEGGSFDIVNYLGTVDGSIEADFLDAYQELTRSRGVERYRAVGATALLQHLHSEGENGRWMTMTYGGEAWQTAKLEAAGLLDQPHRIIKIKEKAKVINGWYDSETEWFDVLDENIATETVCLVDDKAVAFRGLHRSATGYHVYDPANVQPSQQGRVPQRIIKVTSLEQIVEHEKQQLAAS